MQKIEYLIKNSSTLYDLELLKKEFNIIKRYSQNVYTLMDLSSRYRNEHGEKKDNFNTEYKFLNEYNYELLKTIKSIKMNNLTDELYLLGMNSEREIIRSVKSTLQNIINEKEKTLKTYELLLETIQEYIEKEGVFI